MGIDFKISFAQMIMIRD